MSGLAVLHFDRHAKPTGVGAKPGAVVNGTPQSEQAQRDIALHLRV